MEQNESQSRSLAADTFALLRSFSVWVLAVAALDVLRIRLEHPNQPVEILTYVHTVLLWSVFALAALLPALIVTRLRSGSKSASSPTAMWGRTLFCLLLPSSAHFALDRYTMLGQNVAGLFTIRPWLEVGGVVIALWLFTVLINFVMRRFSSKIVVTAVVSVSLLIGCCLPFRSLDVAVPDQISSEQKARPNILLLVWDTTRPDHLTPYGYDRDTSPELSSFAEESLVFDRARSVSIFTFTSHLSMLTGLYPAATGARLYRMRLDPSLSESVAMQLAQSGYRTGAFVGTWVLAATTGIQRGFEVYDDRVDPAVCFSQAWRLVHDVQAVLADTLEWIPSNGMPHWFQDFQRPADEVLARAQEWIEQDDPRPWFCMINLYDVHWPYLPNDESAKKMVRDYDGPMDGYLFRSDNYQSGYVPNERDGRHVADLYDAEILELDQKVGQFLKSLNLDESNTSVILTADHGEAFGEAGRYKHEDVIEPQVRVPLCIRLPGPNPENGLRTVASSGVDIAPTILGLAGLPIPSGLHGVDLLNTDLTSERPILVEDRDHQNINDMRFAYYEGHWKLVRMQMGEEFTDYLYDLSVDPVGEHDLASKHPERTAEFGLRMEAMRAPWSHVDLEVKMTGFGANADALGGLGYLGGDEDDE